MSVLFGAGRCDSASGCHERCADALLTSLSSIVSKGDPVTILSLCTGEAEAERLVGQRLMEAGYGPVLFIAFDPHGHLHSVSMQCQAMMNKLRRRPEQRDRILGVLARPLCDSCTMIYFTLIEDFCEYVDSLFDVVVHGAMAVNFSSGVVTTRDGVDMAHARLQHHQFLRREFEACAKLARTCANTSYVEVVNTDMPTVQPFESAMLGKLSMCVV